MRTTGGGQSALLLFDAIGVLNRETINYAVVGAMAASVHGVVRASIDADAVLSIGVQALKALEHRFKEIGFATELRIGDFDDPIPALLELTDAYGNRVDLLAGIRGLEQAAFARGVNYHRTRPPRVAQGTSYSSTTLMEISKDRCNVRS